MRLIREGRSVLMDEPSLALRPQDAHFWLWKYACKGAVLTCRLRFFGMLPFQMRTRAMF
jgi:hypothetical protein